jgi:Leucine-rich repeat (LRR) protein
MVYTREDLERMKRSFGIDKPGVKKIFVIKQPWTPSLVKRPLEWYGKWDYINYSKRNLDKIPKEIRKYEYTKYIDLSDNNITEICYISDLEKLEELWLDHNKIEKVGGLTHVPNLEKLNLSYNELTEIYKLVYAPSLKNIDLSHNNLSELDFRILSLLPNLEELTLNNNEIKEFCNYKSLKKIKKLKCLEIADNRDLHSHPEYKKTVKALRKKGVLVIDGIFT